MIPQPNQPMFESDRDSSLPEVAQHQGSMLEERDEGQNGEATTQQNRINSELSASTRLQIAQTEWAKFFHNQPPEGRRPMSVLHVNNRENKPLGDPLVSKASNTTRIYSLNLNGIALDRRGGQFDTLCQVAREVQADIVCCQEHNVDTTQARSKAYSIRRQTSIGRDRDYSLEQQMPSLQIGINLEGP